MFYYSRAFRVHISYGLYVFYMLCRVVVFELNHYDSLFVLVIVCTSQYLDLQAYRSIDTWWVALQLYVAMWVRSKASCTWSRQITRRVASYNGLIAFRFKKQKSELCVWNLLYSFHLLLPCDIDLWWLLGYCIQFNAISAV